MRGVPGLGLGSQARSSQSGCSLTAFVVCAAFTKAKLSLRQKAGEIPSGVCLCCLSRPNSPASAHVGGRGDPLPRRDAVSLESEHPREAGCFHDLALCSPVFHKTTPKAPLSSLHIHPHILLLKGKHCGGKEWQNPEEL